MDTRVGEVKFSPEHYENTPALPAATHADIDVPG